MKQHDSTKRRRRWLQFSLRGLLVLMLLVALGLGWIANERRKVWLEARAVEEIERYGGTVNRRSFDQQCVSGGKTVHFGYSDLSGAAQWQQWLFGENYDDPVHHVAYAPGTRPEHSALLRHFSALRSAELSALKIDDRALAALLECPDLEEVRLCATDVTDRGVSRLASLPKLTDVSLDHTAITYDGLSAFRNHSLRFLSIRDTAVTKAQAREFRAEHPELQLFIHSRSPSASHRDAVKRLLQLGASLPYLATQFESPSPGATLITFNDGSFGYYSTWTGNPEDLALLDRVVGKLWISLGPELCTQDYLQALARLDTVEGLRLRTGRRAGETLERLAGMETLRSLEVEFLVYEGGAFTALHDGELDSLGTLPNLKDFSISISAGWSFAVQTETSQSALMALTECPRLKHLSIQSVDIREETLRGIVETLQLYTLNVTPTLELSQRVIDEIQEEL